ncbi:adenylate/guanylate cyclase domain-containing protein [Sulfurimonas sp. SAG-AH-194-C21]|nr:adenylate/guanylate cyclase domain-containing protein [Sulfurimonas sp. SAG-AH-194-C21]
MPQTFFSLDNRLRDFLFTIRGELPTTQKIVIVDIDEKSLKKYGQWPWPRDLLAKLMYKLSDAGAGVVGLDIVFAEEDRSSPHLFSKKFPELKDKLANYDEVFAQALLNTPVVGGYIFTFAKTDQENSPMIPAIFIEKGMPQNHILVPKGVVLNIPLLQDSFYSSGFFNNTPDVGGMIRNIPLIMKYDDVIYPSLVLEMIRIYSGVSKVEVHGDEAGVRNIIFADFNIPTDNVGRLLVNFRGKGRHFKYISAYDILSGNFKVEDVTNKFILVGTSAVGLFDLRSIPFDNAIAGVEVHANAIDNILVGDFLYKPGDMVVYDLISIWSIIFLFMILFSFLKSWMTLPLAIVCLYGIFELFYMLLFEYGVVLNLLFPLFAYFITLVLSVGLDYVISSRQKEEVKRVLGKKVSPAVMDYLLKNTQDDLVASKEVEVTIFFSDIRSFTTISETIGSPDKVIHMLNDYMTPMVDSIIKHKGTIDKFIGDAIMAYWNAPLKVKNHVDMAVQSAIEQIEKLKDINLIVNKKYNVNIAIGIGIHTGIVTAGEMGSEGRSDYTIIGDNVNIASRIEGLTKQYGAEILISRTSLEALKGEYTYRPIDIVKVKGKSKAVEIFEIIAPHRNINDLELSLYNDAISLFRRGAFEESQGMFEDLEKQFSSLLYKYYLKRIKVDTNIST